MPHLAGQADIDTTQSYAYISLQYVGQFSSDLRDAHYWRRMARLSVLFLLNGGAWFGRACRFEASELKTPQKVLLKPAATFLKKVAAGFNFIARA